MEPLFLRPDIGRGARGLPLYDQDRLRNPSGLGFHYPWRLPSLLSSASGRLGPLAGRHADSCRGPRAAWGMGVGNDFPRSAKGGLDHADGPPFRTVRIPLRPRSLCQGKNGRGETGLRRFCVPISPLNLSGPLLVGPERYFGIDALLRFEHYGFDQRICYLPSAGNAPRAITHAHSLDSCLLDKPLLTHAREFGLLSSLWQGRLS